MDFHCTLKINIESQNLDHGCVKDQWSYSNQDQDAKPQSGTSRPHQSPKSGHYGHGCSLHLQNQDRVPKFRTWMYQRPLTISKSRSRCHTPVRNLQRPPNAYMRLKGHWCSLHPKKSRYIAKIWIMGVSKTRDHMQIKIKMPNPFQEPPVSYKDQNEDSKDRDVLCTLKTKIES